MNPKQFVKEIFAQVKRDWYMPVVERQVYDTTETVIGAYMGKPLYRRVVTGTTPSANGYVDTGLSGLENARVAGGFVRISDDNIAYGYNGVSLSITNDGTKLAFLVDNQYSKNKEYVAILEYTKPTDTAAESKVPFEPLTEYSTEERMIGYWIDGKPLYRKVVQIPCDGTAEKKIVPHMVNNIHRVINQYGYWFAAGTTNTSFSLPRSTKEGLQYNMDVYTSATNIEVADIPNSAAEAFVIIEYTKTTD